MKLIYFHYDDKDYSIVLEDNKIKFKVNNKELIQDTDKKIFNYIISSLNVEVKNSINLGIKIYNNHQYELLYDLKKAIYFTISNDISVRKYINFKYNNILDMVYIGDKEENKSQFINRYIKIGKKYVKISVAVFLLGISLGNNIVNYDSFQKEVEIFAYEHFSIVDINNQYDFNEIKDVVLSNPNLSQEEKDFILQLQFVFDENNIYLELDMIKDRLATLKINYTTEDLDDISGIYNSSLNQITLDKTKDFKTCDINVLVHELLHVLQIWQRPGSNNFFMELSNEFFTREVVRKIKQEKIEENKELMNPINYRNIYGDGYQRYMPLYYILSEIVSEDVLRKYQFTCDINILIEGLKKTCVNKDKNDEIYAYKLITEINDCRYFDENRNIFLSKDMDIDTFDRCYEYLDYFHNKKFGCSIERRLDTAIHLFNNTYSSNYNPSSNLCKDSIESLMLNNAYDNPKEFEWAKEGIKEFNNVYVVPRTYLSKDYSNHILVFDTPFRFVTEIDDNIKEEYVNYYSNNQKNK